MSYIDDLMKEDLSKKKCLVWDTGNCTFVAERLARDFEVVYYYNPHVIDGFPVHIPDDIGEGLNNVISIRNVYPYLKDVDLIYFCDLYEDETQQALRDEGKNVFGLSGAQKLETNRILLKQVLEEQGLPVNDYDVLMGVSELRYFLRDKKEKYIKTNYFRGEGETWKFIDSDLSSEKIDKLQHDLGINKEKELFIVEDKIDNAIEIGYDGFTIDGEFPSTTMFGIEGKDRYYVTCMTNYNRLPKALKDINKGLSPYLKQNKARGVMSTEVRYLKNGKGYLIDLCCRQPNPVTSLQLEMYKDYSRISYEIAQGKVPKIEYNWKYGVEIIIQCSNIEEGKPKAIKFDEQYKQFIKIKNLTIDNGVHYYLPQNSMKEIGSCCGVGNSFMEAKNMVIKIAGTIIGDGISVDVSVLDDAEKQIEKLSSYGIDIF